MTSHNCLACGHAIPADERGFQEDFCPACNARFKQAEAEEASRRRPNEAAHDVFISYSSKDAAAAEVVLRALEAQGIRCWVAPRNIPGGADWGASIVDAIGACRVMVLIYTRHSNGSPQVMREVERAINKGIAILPFRIEDEPLSKNMEYFISASHWLDAVDGSLENHLPALVGSVSAMLSQPMAPVSKLPGAGRRLRQQRRLRRVGSLALVAAILAVIVLFLGSRWIADRPSSQDVHAQGDAPQAPAGAAAPSMNFSRFLRELQSRWASLVYKRQLEQEARARQNKTAQTQPASTQPSLPAFVEVPSPHRLRSSDLSDSGPYVVVADYTHPNGRDFLRHTYLGLRSSFSAQTLMYYNLDTIQQWAGEGFFLKDLHVARSEIPNGYRVSYSFRIASGWKPGGRINFETWSNDWDNLEGPHTVNPWQGEYIDATRPE